MKLKTVYVVHRGNDWYDYPYIFGYEKLFSLFGKVYVKTNRSLIYALTHYGNILHFDSKDCFNTVAEAKKAIE